MFVDLIKLKPSYHLNFITQISSSEWDSYQDNIDTILNQLASRKSYNQEQQQKKREEEEEQIRSLHSSNCIASFHLPIPQPLVVALQQRANQSFSQCFFQSHFINLLFIFCFSFLSLDFLCLYYFPLLVCYLAMMLLPPTKYI